MKPIVNKKLRNSARGQACTMNVVGVCNYEDDTTVLAHIQTEGGKMAGKTDDISACFACYKCHDWLDGYKGIEEDRLFYTRRAMVRTWLKWIEMGLIKL